MEAPAFRKMATTFYVGMILISNSIIMDFQFNALPLVLDVITRYFP